MLEAHDHLGDGADGGGTVKGFWQEVEGKEVSPRSFDARTSCTIDRWSACTPSVTRGEGRKEARRRTRKTDNTLLHQNQSATSRRLPCTRTASSSPCPHAQPHTPPAGPSSPKEAELRSGLQKGRRSEGAKSRGGVARDGGGNADAAKKLDNKAWVS